MSARFPPRTWKRGVWRYWYREQRICAREAMKAAQDAMLYGIGTVKIDVNGARHVPYHEVMHG